MKGPHMDAKKNAPAMLKNTASAYTSDPTTSRAPIVAELRGCLKLTPRQARVLAVLRPGGWVSREQIDREAGSSNGPDVIARLRVKLGHDAIDCERVRALDRDGKPCLPGMYRMTDRGSERLRQLEGRPVA
jgi:hypothetical protein